MRSHTAAMAGTEKGKLPNYLDDHGRLEKTLKSFTESSGSLKYVDMLVWLLLSRPAVSARFYEICLLHSKQSQIERNRFLNYPWTICTPYVDLLVAHFDYWQMVPSTLFARRLWRMNLRIGFKATQWGIFPVCTSNCSNAPKRCIPPCGVDLSHVS